MNQQFRAAGRCGTSTCVEVKIDEQAFRAAGTCSTGTCVEVSTSATQACANNNCVEVSGPPVAAGTIFVRDSKQNGQADQPVLAFTPDEWRAFVKGVKAGEFDISEAGSSGGLADG